MLSVATARALAAAGILWEPRAGDRFAIDQPQLDADVFWVSDLTIEVHHYADQTVLGFNGTTEWALDSVGLERTVWLPREDKVRELIGDRLIALTRAEGGWRVTYVTAGEKRECRAADPEEAYAAALLDISAAAD